MSSLLPFQQALRALRRTPGFFAGTVLTLALGMGTCLALFTLFYARLLAPLPYADPGRLAVVKEGHGQETWHLSGPNFLDLRERTRTLMSVAVMAGTTVDLTGSGAPERLQSAEVSGDWLETLGLKPALGAGLGRADEGQPRVMLSHGTWQRRFGGDPHVLGRSLVLQGISFEIVGVAPADYVCPFDNEPEVFLPVQNWQAGGGRGYHPYRGVARLAPGVRPEAAAQELKTLGMALQEAHPQANKSLCFQLKDMREDRLREERRPLTLLLGATLLLMAIACANVANLFLARAVRRRREMALRASLGAGMGRILGLHLAEGLVVATSGMVLGLAFAWAGLKSLPLWLPDVLMQGWKVSAGVGLPVLGAALGLALVSSLGVAVVPAVQARRMDLDRILREGGRSGSARGRRTRMLLVGGEVALAFLLVAISGLFIRALRQTERTDPGFQSAGLVTFRVQLPARRYDNDTRQRFLKELEARVAALPGVRSAGISFRPWLGGSTFSVGYKVAPADLNDGSWAPCEMDSVSGGLMRTLGLRLKAGRLLDERDTAQAPRVCVITDTLARRHFPQGQALGQHMYAGWVSRETPEGTPLEVVGVVEDVRHVRLDRMPEPRILLSAGQVSYSSLNVYLRTDQTPAALRGPIQGVLHEMDPLLPLTGLQRVEALASRNLGNRRLAVRLYSVFSVISLLLAASGIYAVLATSVADQRRDFGVRMALGATARRVVQEVLVAGLRQVLLGMAGGLVLTWASGRILSAELHGLDTRDPLALGWTLALLLVAAFLACLLPALRAARVEPALSLRSE